MRVDHRVVGHVLRALVSEIWQGGGTDEVKRERTAKVIALANAGGGDTRFDWAASTGGELQQVEGHDFVSRFPVTTADSVVGSVVVREPLDETDRLLRSEIFYTSISVAVVVLICLISSLALGGILVGRPIHQLVAKARRVASHDFGGVVELRHAGELGELGDEMNAMSDALSRALAQTARQNEARIHAVEQLRHAERLATVGRLAAGVAHELGTPLSMVSGHAQMIAGREVVGEGVVDSATAIDREADRMGRIVRQLLDFARRKGPEGTTCDPAEVARRCMSLLGPMAEHHHITMSVEATQEPLCTMIDEDSLQHVITNLAVNAVQAMPAGGSLRVSLSRSDNNIVRLDVADTGSGIAPEVLPNIFEPFFTTKPPGQGTGLGLAVVYGIVDDHGGAITVDTHPTGTTFSVSLQVPP